MEHAELPGKSSQPERWRQAADRLQLIFGRAGWKLKSLPREQSFDADLLVRRGKHAYVVELKAASEGRSDRLIPLFAQAALQLMRCADRKAPGLAVVSAPRISVRAAEQVLAFAARYVPDDVAVGVFDFEGLCLFRGPYLEDLNADAAVPVLPANGHAPLVESHNLFSDLNQWLLKVLIAPELPEHLLSAPRGRYSNASQLARAAQVSVMSAFRFLQQLQERGLPARVLVADRIWCGGRTCSRAGRHRAIGRFGKPRCGSGFPATPKAQLQKVLGSGRACLGLFAAADALGLGFVHGIPPHVYVERVQPSSLAAWKNLRPCEPGEPPDVVAPPGAGRRSRCSAEWSGRTVVPRPT